MPTPPTDPLSNPFESPASTRQTFERARHVVCSYDGITVTVARQQLQPLKVASAQLTFAEEGCVATENSTHFVLSTTLLQCATRSHIEEGGGQVRYTNTVSN